ncbi:A24 family peptidase C-terminal domain-containing protein [Thermococcus sp. MAR1]|uniref:A24 family peptidase C-terminal domain-containing protein n=1 Tax=Thermococcus sp. MAR1 TaxID=1638263 RepID=UPI00143956A2|nr:A24 family peptidase C-terminal domain-containing protein [Thermococcus sp. MAR1]NJE10842.1 transposase [Thermococcus sp. MAR1]
MDYVPLILGLVMGVVTSYTDVKTGFVFDNHIFPTLTLIGKLLGWEEEGEDEEGLPGWIPRLIIPAVEVGIIYHLYLGISRGDALLAASGLIGLVLGFVLGLLLYYLGAWASGDAVILAGFSALLPYAPATASIVAPYTVEYPLYPLTILLNSIIAIFPFIFVYAFGVLIVRRKFAELRAIFTERARLTLELSLWIMAALGLRLIIYEVTGASIVGLWSWVFTIGVIYVLGKFRRVGDVIGIGVLAYLVYQEPATAVGAFLRLLAVLYLFKVFLSLVKFMRTEVLMEEVTVEDLREWDILGETVFERDGKILRDRTDTFTRIKNALLSADLNALHPDYGRVIASPTAEGLSREQIEELKCLVEEGRLENRFLRKKSMPFAPALFLGFLISYFWGDMFWWIQLKIAGL